MASIRSGAISRMSRRAQARPSPSRAVSLIAEDRQLGLRQPPPEQEDHLPGPARHGLMAQPQPPADLGRRRRDAQYRQRPGAPTPGWGDDQGQDDPAQAAGRDRPRLAGGERVTVMAALGDAAPPPPLERLVDDEGQLPARARRRHGSGTGAAVDSVRGPTNGRG